MVWVWHSIIGEPLGTGWGHACVDRQQQHRRARALLAIGTEQRPGPSHRGWGWHLGGESGALKQRKWHLRKRVGPQIGVL